MKPTVTRGATNVFSKPENWDDEKFGPCGDLQVRMDVFGGNEKGIIECYSTWKPSAGELAMLNAGGVIEVGICLPNQPVMSVSVVEPMEPALIKYVSQEGASITINEHAHGDDSHGA